MPQFDWTSPNCWMCGKPNRVVSSKFFGLVKKWEFETTCTDCLEADKKLTLQKIEAGRELWRLKRKKLIGR